MQMFFKIPTGSPPVDPPVLFLANIPRSASTSFSKAILQQFYPTQYAMQQAAWIPNTNPRRRVPPQFFVPSTKSPLGTLLGVTRNPLDRFCSGFTRLAGGLTVDQVIAQLQAGTPTPDAHIRRVSDMFPAFLPVIQWYRFDRDLAALATALGLASTPPAENQAVNPPALTDVQTTALQAYYATDIAIYNAITAAGGLYSPE